MSACCPKLGQEARGFTKPRREVHTVFIHCTATSNPSFDAVACNEYHLGLGWSCIGYHYLVTSNGIVQHGRDVERVPSAQAGYNTGSIAISLNGLRVADFTETQFKELRTLCASINLAYGGTIRFRGHCEVSAKACPVFDYRRVLGLDAKGHMTGVVGEPLPALATVPQRPLTVAVAQLGLGDEHPQVPLLRALLEVALDPPHGTALFDANLQSLVRHFQEDEGLVADGICGPATWERLLDVGSD